MGQSNVLTKSGVLRAVGGTLIVAAGLVPLIAPETSAAQPTGIQKIQHVVIIMQENRSFDHYFGMYPGANGIPRTVTGVPTVCLPDPAPSKSCQRPYLNTADFNGGGKHDQPDAVADIDGGKMDGFVRNAGAHSDVMGYHDAEQIPNYWGYASNYVLQDGMFAPDTSWSLPVHLDLVSGWSALCTQDDDPMSCTNNSAQPANPSSAARPNYAWTDLTYLLHKNNVPWAYYVAQGTAPDCYDGRTTCPYTGRVPQTENVWNPLPYFDTVRDDGQSQNVQVLSNFFSAAASGTLPAVSWIAPDGNTSEHPGGSLVSTGERYTTSLINAIMQSPNWNSTAIFLTWDEWSGFYDHVNPPTLDVNGLGIRVPGLVISPYAKKGFIDHQPLSFDSYLKFIEDDFLGGQRIDPKTDGRPDPRPDVRENSAKLGDLANDFDFTQTPRPPWIIPPDFQPGPPPPPAPSWTKSSTLALSIAGPESAQVGSPVSYTVTATNNDPSKTATSPRLTDYLPPGSSFVSATGSCQLSSRTVTCPEANLPPHASVNETIVVSNPTQRLTMDTASVSSTDGRGAGAIAATNINFLSVAKTGPATDNVGDTINYSLTVTNNNSGRTATGVVLRDTLSSGTKFISASSGCSASGSVVTCNVGDIAPLTSQSETITAKAVSQMANGNGLDLFSLGNGPTVSATSTNGGATSSNPVFTSTGMLATSSNFPSQISTGDTVPFSIQVSNAATLTPANSVVLTDRLPQGSSVVSMTGSCTKSTSGSTTTVSCPEGTVQPGQTVSETVTATFPVAGFQVNTLTATSSNGGSSLTLGDTIVSLTGWPQFRYSPLHQADNTTEGYLSTANVGHLTQTWDFVTGSWIFSSPAIANGMVYVGGGDGFVYAVNATTGALVWKAQTNGPIHASPAVSNGIVYVGSTGSDHNLYAYDAFTGALRWSYDTGSGVAASPTVVGGVVYQPGGSSIFAFDAVTGHVIWQTPTPNPVITTLAASGGQLYGGDLVGFVYGFNASTGARTWTYNTGTGRLIYSSPTVANGLVYIGSEDHNLYAINASTGTLKWKFTTGNQEVASPAYANGIVYVASNDHKMYALNATTGAQLWHVGTGLFLDASPAVANGVVYEGSDDGSLYVYNAKTGALLRKITLPDWIQSSAAVAGDLVVVGCGRLPQQGTALDHGLHAFKV